MFSTTEMRLGTRYHARAGRDWYHASRAGEAIYASEFERSTAVTSWKFRRRSVSHLLRNVSQV